MVNPAKVGFVQQLAKDIQQSPVIGLVNMHNLPAAQLQRMRSMLRRQDVHITMARKKLLRRALQGSQNDKIDALTQKIKGMPALLLTNTNPFLLYKTIQKNKSEAPARPGQVAPKDLLVKAGPTNFAPGPIISELAAVGIKTKVEGGKLTIIADTTIVREGQVITQKVSDTLKRLEIKPMEIGLDLVAVWERGMVFEASQLHIDEAEYFQNFAQAARWAIEVAVEAAYPATETTDLLLQKAFREAKALSLELNFITDLTAGEILAKVEREALAIIAEGKIEIPEKSPHPAEKTKEASLPVLSSHPTPVQSHPKQGTVTQDQAAQLLATLQKKGTLR